MEIVIEQSKLRKTLPTYQAANPKTLNCRKCKHEAILFMHIHDDEGVIMAERPLGVRVWPHDKSVIAVYLCTECGSMRARWNQG